MNTITKVAIAAGGTIALIGGIVLASGLGDSGQPSLYVSTSNGGQIGGSFPSANTAYTFTAPTTITVGPVIPSSGYIFKGWYLNNQLLSTAMTTDVLVNKSNLRLSAVFLPEGGIIPANIISSQLIVYPSHHLEVWKSGYDPERIDVNDYLHIGTRIDHVERQFEKAIIQYKVVDNNGNGVPNCPIDFSIPAHDVTEPNFTNIAVEHPNGWMWYADLTPIQFISDSQGVIKVPIVFAWVPPQPTIDYGEITRGKYTGGLLPAGVVHYTFPIPNDQYAYIIDNSPVYAGIGWSTYWKEIAWLTGPYSDVSKCTPTPQISEVLVYTSPIITATASYADNNQISNNTVTVIGRVYMPPNQKLVVYRGDYK